MKRTVSPAPERLRPAERETYRRYAGLRLPRHTSYPAVPHWREDYGAAASAAALARSDASGNPLSIYLHVPYCEKLCYFCACNKTIVPKRPDGIWRRQAEALVEALLAEIRMRAPQLDLRREVRQVHLGGGSPTYLDERDLDRLLGAIRGTFRVAPDAEVAVEVDPRITSAAQIRLLRRHGLNRVSLGVQDFDPAVQNAVNRTQPFEQVRDFVALLRAEGIPSVNMDLIYGLPFQTPESMRQTLDRATALRPDRVAFYRLAVIPEMFKWQNVFAPRDLPGPDATLEMFLDARDRFEEAGYVFVGLDHFALPEEPLARAAGEGTVRRSFQGMTTGRSLDVLGIGPSAISLLPDAFFQDEHEPGAWAAAVGRGDVPVVRGMDLSPDDRLRQDVLQALYGEARVGKRAIEARHGIRFDERFADEIGRLRELEGDGIVRLSGDAVELTPVLGRLLMRVPAAVFDAYLPRDAYRVGLPAAASSAVG
ncbi:MAG: oxygen-independent coproporphyrinogen III oxidase [Planctomycetales bacterium]|nr:oxygen-independent coproporphyrinogen III oxidase [Planctomycetales bacterium]